MIVAFTGHRPDKIGGYATDNPQIISIKQALHKKLVELKPDKCISGMALGVDQIAALACVGLQIPFIAAVPFNGQEMKWPIESQDYYRWLIGKAEEVITVTPGAYAPIKMQLRNEWMVDGCDHLIAVFDGSKGGTHNCVQYAKRQGKEMTIINPKDFIPKTPAYQRPGYI